MPDRTSLLSSVSFGKEPPLGVCLRPLERGTICVVFLPSSMPSPELGMSVVMVRGASFWWVNVESVEVIRAGLWTGILGGRQIQADGRTVAFSSV